MDKNELIFLAKQNDPQAQCNLGLIFANPEQEEFNIHEAFYWLEISAKQGFSDAQFYLANLYEQVNLDWENAMKWYKIAAEQGNVNAQITLGYFYENGIEVEIDYESAVKWYEKASRQGSAMAQFNLARCYEQGKGVAKDLSKSIVLYTQAAEQGFSLPDILNDLGLYYMTGEYVDKDEQKAIYWLTKAAEHNIPQAYANLGGCYLLGIGINKDTTEALKLLSIAIKLGIDDAEDLVFENIELNELIDLANNENAQAEYFLALHFITKKNPSKDDVNKAINLLHSSAQKGEALAMVMLGKIYAGDQFITPDLFKSEKLFSEAEKLGSVEAKTLVNAIRNTIACEAPCYLVKILDEKWAEKLMDGEIFMRAISCFAPLENWIRQKKNDPTVQNSFRGDNMEGFTKSFGEDTDPLGMNLKHDIPLNSFGFIDAKRLREKIYCLYSYEYDKKHKCFIKPDSQLVDFGDTAVIITNPQSFLERVSSAINKRFNNLDFYMAYHRVIYNIDTSSNKEYNEFCKSKDYLWQKEFRIALDLSEGKIDKTTLDNTTDYALLQYLNTCNKLGLTQKLTYAPSNKKMHNHAKFNFRNMIKIDENPDSISDSLTINIGDIRDICIAIPTSEFVNLQDIDYFIKKGKPEPVQISPFMPQRPPMPTLFRAIASCSQDMINTFKLRDKWKEENGIK